MDHDQPNQAVYMIIWEYEPKEGFVAEFEKAYSEDGDWVRFFKKGEGYISTQFFRDADYPDRYVTIDYWKSEEAYRTFEETHRSEYKELDERLEQFTESEILLGGFTQVRKSE